ncbi:MAG: transcription termination factor NusA [Defluviitaleaceae bacterium]|nr:transcription termination factor NusA [Defluviitaleaceae bacterium]
MDNGRELIEALAQVSHEKGIDKEVIFEALEASLVAACKKQLNQNADIRVVLDRDTGKYTVLAKKTVSEEIEDAWLQISLEDARCINSKLELDDQVDIDVTPKNFGRIAAQNAKQVVVQKFREAEREILFNEYIGKEHQLAIGIVQRRDRRNVVLSLGKLETVLLPSEQIPREGYQFGDRVKVYVTEVKQSNKGPVINASRACPELLQRLFEQEVPEILDGIVEIKSIAREAGSRSKVAVYTRHPHVDAIGACVGQNGQRVNIISAELRGEKIDIVLWNDDPVKFISQALSPSKVVSAVINPSETEARVVVPDHQLSLAIGKEGQNVRLAARLTGWRIDIKSESQARGTDFLVFPQSPEDLAEMESAYADFYDTSEPLGATEPEALETPEAAEATEEYYDDGLYYDEESGYYYDDEGRYYYYDTEKGEYIYVEPDDYEYEE